ncbi:hypothetical protein [Kitasatospora sp. NPDC004531]
MTTAVRGTLLGAAPLLALVPLIADASARAGAAAPTTDATCVLNGRGAFADAVGPGGVDLPVGDTLAITGTVTCVDRAGAPAASGTFTRTVSRPATDCTGEELDDGSTAIVHWNDTTMSTIDFDRTAVRKVNGTASLVAGGRVSANSARFADDTVEAVGTTTSTGCGTPTGATAAASTLVLRLAH